ncbi:M15 family metallopeptidase [Blastochloris viridis]|nr:M15 family metallopeptidase [Blastochloris viridis]BAR98717.1 D-alanyl-D-alanine dipeptidase [Blastochloris viridis]
MVRARQVPFDGTDGRSREPLVEARAFGLVGECYYAIRDGRNPPYGGPIEGAIPDLLVRQGVAEALIRVERALAPHGLALWLHDGWRPLLTQRGLWTFYERKVRRDNPSWPDVQIAHEVATFIADPRGFDLNDPGSWPPHLTGGAVDLVLRLRETDTLLDFGAGFDHAGERSETDFFEREFDAGRVRADDPRLLARRILTHAMAAEGFTNYAEEYWHFDLGTKLWAAVVGNGARAFYRPVLAP